jgi:hypothetical protein
MGYLLLMTAVLAGVVAFCLTGQKTRTGGT